MERKVIRQRGVSLVELIMFIVIIGIALVSLLGLMNTLTRDSVDPMIRKQALAVAEAEADKKSLPSGYLAVKVQIAPVWG